MEVVQAFKIFGANLFLNEEAPSDLGGRSGKLARYERVGSVKHLRSKGVTGNNLQTASYFAADRRFMMVPPQPLNGLSLPHPII